MTEAQRTSIVKNFVAGTGTKKILLRCKNLGKLIYELPTQGKEKILLFLLQTIP
jgi:hypothetical protein